MTSVKVMSFLLFAMPWRTLAREIKLFVSRGEEFEDVGEREEEAEGREEEIERRLISNGLQRRGDMKRRNKIEDRRGRAGEREEGSEEEDGMEGGGNS